jgi:hypothetical protein
MGHRAWGTEHRAQNMGLSSGMGVRRAPPLGGRGVGKDSKLFKVFKDRSKWFN